MSATKSAISIGSHVWFRVPSKSELESTDDFSGNNNLGPFTVIGRADPDHISIEDKNGTILRASGGFWAIGHFIEDTGDGPPTKKSE